MTNSQWFWIIFVVALLFSAAQLAWPGPPEARPKWLGSVPVVVFWVLMFLLALGTYGSPMKG